MRSPVTYIKIITNFIVAILIALFIILVVPKLLGFFLPFVIGWIVSMIANPLVKFLEKHVKLLRKHSSAIIIAIAVAAIVGVVYLFIFIFVKEVGNLVNDFPNIAYSIELQFAEALDRLKTFAKTMPMDMQQTIDNAIVGIENMMTEFGSQIQPPTIREAGSLVSYVADLFLMIIITILSAYFFIAGRDDIIEATRSMMSQPIIDGWHLIYDNFKSAVGGYFKAQFKIMLILTVVMFVGFEILRVDYSFLLALGTAFLDFLPVFGTGAVLWPWALIDMITGNYVRAIGLIVIYLACQVIKQILQPKMVGDSIGLSPLSTLVFMYVGYRFYGVLGMIIGVPTGMVLVNLYRIGMFDRIIKGFRIIIHDLNEFRKF